MLRGARKNLKIIRRFSFALACPSCASTEKQIQNFVPGVEPIGRDAALAALRRLKEYSIFLPVRRRVDRSKSTQAAYRLRCPRFYRGYMEVRWRRDGWASTLKALPNLARNARRRTSRPGLPTRPVALFSSADWQAYLWPLDCSEEIVCLRNMWAGVCVDDLWFQSIDVSIPPPAECFVERNEVGSDQNPALKERIFGAIE